MATTRQASMEDVGLIKNGSFNDTADFMHGGVLGGFTGQGSSTLAALGVTSLGKQADADAGPKAKKQKTQEAQEALASIEDVELGIRKAVKLADAARDDFMNQVKAKLKECTTLFLEATRGVLGFSESVCVCVCGATRFSLSVGG